jgi:hypothetical protein
MKKFKKLYIFLIIIAVLAGGILFLSRETADSNRQIQWGVTFEKDFAKKLGLDWQTAYMAMLDDLKIKKLRISARWSEIEPVQGEFNFTDLDWQVQEAAKRNVKIILVVGYKVPRWPECHDPAWISDLRPAVLSYIEKTVNRYKENSAIFAWQVENEPFLPFGDECPKFDVNLLDEEISLVKKLDKRPVVVTDSGELSIWVRAAWRADIFGTTMYRWVWNQYLGSYKYPIPAGFFRFKERLVRLFVGQEKPFVVIELQGEPWTHKQIYEISLDEQLGLMPFSEFTALIDYAKATGFSQYYLWGVEWWYSLKQQNHPEYWEHVKGLVSHINEK